MTKKGTASYLKTRCGNFRLVSTWWGKLRGLLGSDCTAQAIALIRCKAIHSYAMSYAIDVAVVAQNGCVLTSVCHLDAGCLIKAQGGFLVLERPASQSTWFACGEYLDLSSVHSGR